MKSVPGGTEESVIWCGVRVIVIAGVVVKVVVEEICVFSIEGSGHVVFVVDEDEDEVEDEDEEVLVFPNVSVVEGGGASMSCLDDEEGRIGSGSAVHQYKGYTLWILLTKHPIPTIIAVPNPTNGTTLHPNFTISGLVAQSRAVAPAGG